MENRSAFLHCHGGLLLKCSLPSTGVLDRTDRQLVNTVQASISGYSIYTALEERPGQGNATWKNINFQAFGPCCWVLELKPYPYIPSPGRISNYSYQQNHALPSSLKLRPVTSNSFSMETAKYASDWSTTTHAHNID
jgi:hypothetical protein